LFCDDVEHFVAALAAVFTTMTSAVRRVAAQRAKLAEVTEVRDDD
jgi:hypothetical protein